MNFFLSTALKLLLFSIPFSVLIYAPSFSVYPSIISKSLFFRGMVQGAFFIWIVINVRTRRYLPKKHTLLFLLAVYVMINLLADISGVNFHKSFWSTLERMTGTIFQLHLFVYVILISTVLTRERLWKPYLISHVMAGVGVCLYGYYDSFFKAGINNITNTISVDDITILSSTLGNRSFTASYLLVGVFVALLLLVRSENKKERYLFSGCVLLFFAAILTTLNRGAPLGIFLGCFLGCVMVVLTHKKYRTFKILLCLGSVFLGLGIFFSWVVFSGWGQEFSIFKRYTLVSLFPENPRVLVWKIALNGFWERPFLGYGNENFDFVFNIHYIPELLQHEEWFDNVHNIFIERLISTGVLGFISFLGIWITCYRVVFKKRKQISIKEQWVLYGAFSAFFIKGMFVFEAFADAILFYTLLGFLVSGLPEFEPISGKISKERIQTIPAGKYSAMGLCFIGGLFYFCFYYSVWNEVRLNKMLADVVSSNHISLDRRYRTADVYFKENRMNPFFPPVLFSKFTISVISSKTVSREIKNQFSTLNIKSLESSIERYPNQAKLYAVLGEFFVKVGLYDKAIRQFEAALQLSPRRANLIFFIGAIQLHQKKYTSAYAAFRKGLKLNPEYEPLQKFHALACLQLGRLEEAENTLGKPLLQSLVQQDNVFRTAFERAVLISNGIQ